ncbi:MAG: hypothetical protein ABIT01_01015, partial [Thermoanaerobaculia bacterium]
VAGVLSAQAGPVDYDIVYVRAPRHGDTVNSFWPDAITPLLPEAGANLMLLHPDGSEEVLFDAGAKGAVVDPTVSFDARSVVFSFYPDVVNVNTQRGVDAAHSLALAGADIYRIDLSTRVVTRLTFQEFTPNMGNGADFDCARAGSNCPRVGVFNTGPAFLPGGRIVFTSTRNNFVPNRSTHGGQRVMQLFVMDGDGRNVHNIGYLNAASAMHPFVLRDGRIAFTSWENMGLRDDRSFILWAIRPDGTGFEPFSGFGDLDFAHHFMTQGGDGSIVVCRYYNLNNNGFGQLYRFPIDGSGIPGAPLFAPIPPDTAPVDTIALRRVGFEDLTPFTPAEDVPAPCRVGDLPYPVIPCAGGNGTRVGKFTHPSAAPGGELLIVYTRGAANHNGGYVSAGLTQPFYDGGLYRMRGDAVLSRPEDLVLVKNDPAWNEQWPRAVVPYSRIHGVAEPAVLPDLRNDGAIDARLPAGTPLGLVGSSSLISRDTRPLLGDRFYPHLNFGDRNWSFQGADAGLYTDDDVFGLRILGLVPITDRSYPDNERAFDSRFSERVRILGEIPVRKAGVLDAQGNEDTSFLVRIPADVHFTFQTLDRNGLVLNSAQTWHQVRPGEKRYDCGGCHAHSKPALDFQSTAASRVGYPVVDMALQTPLLAVDGTRTPGITLVPSHAITVEYLRDVRPIFQAKCASCHTARGRAPAAGLDLDADDRLADGFPATYALLLRRQSPQNSTPRAVTPEGDWYGPQASRFIRGGQARQSLLAWKIFGKRLDGRTNADRPTETVPGDPATIPAGAAWPDCDLDYVGEAMPPPSSGLTLTWAERMTIARWIDIGSPLERTGIAAPGPRTFAGFFDDDTRPTLALAPELRSAADAGRITRFVLGAYDLESGLVAASLSLTLDVAQPGHPAGENLAAGSGITEGGTVTLDLAAPIDLTRTEVTATAEVRDAAGHVTRVVRSYRRSAVCTLTAPTLTAPASVTAGFTGLLAQVPAHSGSAYSWGVTNGTLLTGQGTNAISFSAAKVVGVARLTAVETDAAGCVSEAAIALVRILPRVLEGGPVGQPLVPAGGSRSVFPVAVSVNRFELD